MKFAAIAIVALGVSVAGSAVAAERISDVEYLKANRCKGLATSLGASAETAALNDFVKASSRGRSAFVAERADAEFDRAKREARNDGRKQQLSAELSNACQAYTAAAQPAVAKN